MKTLCIRVDGNETIATGHLVRCLSIARAFRSFNNINIISQNKVIFIVSDEISQKLLCERFELSDEFDILVLGTSYNALENEVSALIDCIRETDCDALLIDSYFVTEQYFRSLHESLSDSRCVLAYLDDLAALSNYDVDVIINYGVSHRPAQYKEIPSILIGAAFTPLREQFAHPVVSDGNISGNIFISSGGTDEFNMSLSLINGIRACKELTSMEIPFNFHVLTGRLNLHYQELISLSEADPSVHIYEGVSDVASIMKKCDAAVSAAGTTLNELCALGIPTVSYIIAANQRNGAAEYDALGIISCAGDVTESPSKKDAVIDNILNKLIDIYSFSKEERLSRSDAMQAHIDGRGAYRIAEELAKD